MDILRKNYPNGAASLFDLTPEEQINHQRLCALLDGENEGKAITVFVKRGDKITNEIVIV